MRIIAFITDGPTARVGRRRRRSHGTQVESLHSSGPATGLARLAIVPKDTDGRSCLVRLRQLVRERWRPYVAYCGVILDIDLFRNWAVLADAGVSLEEAAFSLRGMHPLGYIAGMAVPIFAALVASHALGLRGARHAVATLVALAVGTAPGLAALTWHYGGVLNPTAVGSR
jgi:hypothetical protein